MTNSYDTIIVGQGLAGTTLAWKLIEAGQRVLVVDAENGHGSSRVAAGLMTPVTGKRMVCSPSFESDWNAAVRFYGQVEDRLGVPLLSQSPIIRVFDKESDRQGYLQRSDDSGFVKSKPWEGQLETGGKSLLGVEIGPAGRLNVQQYLRSSREYFQEIGGYKTATLGFDGDIRMADNSYELLSLGAEASRMVLCQGAVLNERFPKVPNNPVKGEIWKVRLKEAKIQKVVHRSIWIAPDNFSNIAPESHVDGKAENTVEAAGKRYTVGATYEWRDFELSPSAKGAAELERRLAYLVKECPEVQQTLVGIRPTMKDREAVLGEHQDFRGLWVFNGLGSKGTLKSPRLADDLLKSMCGGHDITKAESYTRLLPTGSTTHMPLTKLAQQKISEILKAGDFAVDATVGRGFDTTFLSRKVGQTGRVLGFDVQEEALQATARRLAAIGADNVKLVQQGHETASEVLVGESVQAAMFNLGFLPKSDRAVKTSQTTTMTAIESIYQQMVVGGRMTLLCYRGHEGGPEEFAAIGVWLKQRADIIVERIESKVTKPTSPVLYVVTRKL
ncbi:MAG: FAD-dependent oxidoreductase [Fuerstiella sp.]